jgi:hypothetical protein
MIWLEISYAGFISSAFFGILLLLYDPPEPYQGPFFWTLRGKVREL